MKKSFVILFVAAACTFAGEPSDLRPFTPAAAASEGCRIQNRTITLFDTLASQASDEPIVLECEDAQQLVFQPNAFSLAQKIEGSAVEYDPQSDDPGASGGKYIDFCSGAMWQFNVASAGEYTIWVRLRWMRRWVPFLPSRMQVDELPSETINAIDAPAANTWFWVKCPLRTLTKGVHTLRVNNLHGGTRMDKIMLAKDSSYVPSGIDLPASAKSAVREGEVIFETMSPVGLKEWDHVAFDVKGGGTIRAAASFDDGKTWQDIPADMSLRAMKAPSKDRITLKLALSRGGGKPPEVNNFTAWHTFDKDKFISLENKYYQFLFSKDKGALTGIKNMKTGTVYLPFGSRLPMFDILLKAPGAEACERLSSSDATLVETRTSATNVFFAWALKGGAFALRPTSLYRTLPSHTGTSRSRITTHRSM